MLNIEDKIDQLHDHAMDIAEQADQMRRRGQIEQYNRLLLKAYAIEANAANDAKQLSIEPTRSMVLQSAASLALEAKQFHDAEQWILAALAGQPPHPMRDEFKTLLNTVRQEQRFAMQQQIKKAS